MDIIGISQKLKSPLVVFWELTKACNLRCRHCYTHSGVAEPGLNADELDRILDILIGWEIFSLGLGGGEPLIVPSIYEIIEKATANGMDVSLSTNGTLVTSSNAARLKSAGANLVQVSLDGLQNTHDTIRGDSSFDRASRAVKFLKEAGLTVRVAMTVNNLNKDEIQAVFDHSKSLGADWFIVFRYMNSGREGDTLLLTANDLRKCSKKMIELQKAQPTKVFYEKLLFHPQLHDAGLVTDKSCNAGTSIMNICWNGDATPCPHVRELVVGNVLRDSLDDLWRSPAIMMEGEIPHACKKCSFAEACRGGCKGVCELSQRDSLCWHEIEALP